MGSSLADLQLSYVALLDMHTFSGLSVQRATELRDEVYEEESLPSVKANAEIAQFAQGWLNTYSYFLLTRIDYIKPRSHPTVGPRSLLVN